MPHPEITADVDLVLPTGRLNPSAVGWSRTPHHVASFKKPDLRSKKWEWWAIVTPRHVIGFTVADARYAGLVNLHILDRHTGAQTVSDVITPCGAGVELQERSGSGTTRGGNAKLAVRVRQGESISTQGKRTSLQVRGTTIVLDAVVDHGDRDSLGVVVPWSDKRFQYTVKDVGAPASGTYILEGERFDFGTDGSFAVLDHGRGIWPYSMRWNWAAAAAMDGRDLAVTLGGQWTDGTGATEDGLFTGGTLHKHHGHLQWSYDRRDWMSPWRMVGEHADITFHPEHLRVSRTNLLVLSMTTHQAFGTFEGWMADSSGACHAVDGLYGWAEEADNRW